MLRLAIKNPGRSVGKKIGDNELAIGLILPAGGKGARYGDSRPKQFHLLNGKPLFLFSLETFSSIEEIDEIILVLPEKYIPEFRPLCGEYPGLKITSSGNERWQSVRNGFEQLSPGVEYVLVHDVARPFVPVSVIRRCIQSVRDGNNTITALPVADTVKRIEGGLIRETLDRKSLVQVQTPQAFHRQVLEEVYKKINYDMDVPTSSRTDEAGMVEKLGKPVAWIPGSPLSFKITEPEDFKRAEFTLNRRKREDSNPDD